MSENTQSTSVPNEWLGKSEFDNRIKAFSNQLRVDESKVREILSDAFGIDGQDSRSLDAIDSDEFTPFGDMRQEFIENRKVSKLAMLRMAMPHLRGKTSLNNIDQVTVKDLDLSNIISTVKDMVSSNRSKDQWSDKELLSKLDFENPEIANILSKRTHSRPCIVFDSNGNIDVEISSELVKTAKRQNTNSEHVVNGKHVRVYRAGEFPPIPLDESPFNIGAPLVNGYCSSSNTIWRASSQYKTSSPESRILARIYWQHCENRNLSKMELSILCEDAHLGPKHMREKYSKAALMYDEMEKENRLPTLKIYNQGTAREIKIDRAGM